MESERTLIDVYLRWRSKYWRLHRLLFPSPAELKLIVLMGGKVLTFKWLKSTKTGFPFALVISRGRLFRHERVRREVRCGRYYIDFGNDIGRCIEVDGTAFHLDVVADYDREIYMTQRGWRLLRIKAPRIWNDPDRLQAEIVNFLAG